MPAANCRSGNASLQQARSQQTQNPAAARQNYAKAAAAYRRAGDKAKAQAALKEAAALANAVASATTPSPTSPATPSTAVAKLEPSSSTTPSQVSGASQAPPASPQSAAMPRHWMGTADPEDCAAANDLEKNTAAYYDTCVPDPPDDDTAAWRAKFHFTHYVPPISPQDLTHRANMACESVHWDGKRKCIDEFKIKTLLAEDADVQKACAAVSDPAKQVRCIDAVYVFGPGARWDNSLREALAASLAAGTKDTADAAAEPQPIGSKAAEVDLDTHDGCGRGQGMKPTPGAFGAWSCQALGAMGLPLMPGTKDGDGKDQADPVAAFEDSVDGVAATIADATVKASGAAETERAACLTASYAAVHGTLKGATKLPTACGSTPEAARAELLRYARAHIDTLNPGTEELLAYLAGRKEGPSAHGAAGAPLGDDQSARLTACIVSGGETLPCASVVSASKPKGGSCSDAEAHWKSSEEIKTIPTYEDHLLRFPTCSFAGLATARIDSLLKQ